MNEIEKLYEESDDFLSEIGAVDISGMEPVSAEAGITTYNVPLDGAWRGESVVNLTGIPEGRYFAQAWVTECSNQGVPHVGKAFIYTKSVNLNSANRFVRVRFNVAYKRKLRVSVMLALR